MTVSPISYGTLMLTNMASMVGAWIVLALDPTVQVALIVSVPTTIVGVGTLLLGYLNYKQGIRHGHELKEIKVDVNSNFSRMQDTMTQQTAQLDQKTTKLSDVETELGRAQGVKEGSDAERARPK